MPHLIPFEEGKEMEGKFTPYEVLEDWKNKDGIQPPIPLPPAFLPEKTPGPTAAED